MKWSKLFCAWKTATSTMLSEEKNATRASTNTLTVNAYTTDHRTKSHSFYQRLLPENSQQNLAYKTCFSISSRLHDWLWTTGSVSTFTLTVTSSSLCIHSLLSIHSNSSRTDRGHLSHSLMTFFPSTLCSVTIWNSLSSEIKAINNFHSFTRSVKSFLLDVYVWFVYFSFVVLVSY